MASVTLQHVEKRHGPLAAVVDLSLNVADGEHLALVGPSGCGKTTLLHLVAGVELPTTGSILFDGLPAPKPQDRNLAAVFQDDALSPRHSVFQNIAAPLHARKVPRPAILQRVSEAMRLLGIEHWADRRPRELAAGQRRLVALARALARRPAVWLLDEPLAHLDASLRGELRQLLKRRQRELQLTTLHATHDLDEAMATADRIAVLRQGRLEQVGPPLKIYREPENCFVAAFFGQPPMSFLEMQLVEDSGGRWALAEPLRIPISSGFPVATGQPLVLGLRPDWLAMRPQSSEAIALAGQVSTVEHLGHWSVVRLRVEGLAPIVARLPARDAPTPGEPATFYFLPRQVLWFEADAAGKRVS